MIDGLNSTNCVLHCLFALLPLGLCLISELCPYGLGVLPGALNQFMSMGQWTITEAVFCYEISNVVAAFYSNGQMFFYDGNFVRPKFRAANAYLGHVRGGSRLVSTHL